MTKTERYIRKAIKKEANNFKRTTDKNCHIEMPVMLGEAVSDIARSLAAQADANKANAEALRELASKLGNVNSTAIHIAS